MEADEGYSRTELDRFLSQERAMEETQGELKVRVEGLEAELQRAYATIDEQESKVISLRPIYLSINDTLHAFLHQVVVQRAPEDIERIAELETSANKLNEELAYYKQELIDARARKSASDDELGTVRGKLETLDNTISSLSTEGKNMRQMGRPYAPVSTISQMHR